MGHSDHELEHTLSANITRKNEKGDDTRRAIVLAAVRTIAEKGLEGASLRSINAAAGSRNASAAHYHFGTRLAMVEAAIALLFEYVAPEQNARLDALEARAAAGEAPAVREILAAVYAPFFELLKEPDFGGPAAKFLSRLLIEADEQIQESLNRSVLPLILRAQPLFELALPEVPQHLIALRMFITVTNVIHGAGDLSATRHSPWGVVAGSQEQFFQGLLDYMSAGMAAPG